ncbi:hypothetical protein L6452_43154 [Arctium lappa]|uniref:Uncharacterized protein n=1 Tax=Arctium lappa TaxID=4217 RepID=A0ACB8XKT9_ARCLA|nr:hypothetical protein L6452_43154 [Arctium lappa]
MTTIATVLSLFFIIASISGTTAGGRGNTTAATPILPPAPAPSAGGGSIAKKLIKKDKGAGGGGGPKSFVVEGRVYCDPCRIKFPTKISTNIPNTKVILGCRKRENDAAETYTVEGTSDPKGMYSITASGDHEEEICDVRVKESPDKKCSEVMGAESTSRVSLTDKNGVRGKTRTANPIGFMTKEVDPRCKEILNEIGLGVGY